MRTRTLHHDAECSIIKIDRVQFQAEVTTKEPSRLTSRGYEHALCVLTYSIKYLTESVIVPSPSHYSLSLLPPKGQIQDFRRARDQVARRPRNKAHSYPSVASSIWPMDI